MILATLIMAGALALALAALRPELDRSLAWLYAGLVAAIAGFRGGGFDYDEYLLIIDSIRETDAADWATRLFFAKDPLFLLVIVVCSWITASTTPIFLVMAAAAMAAKVAATREIVGRRTSFIVLYTILLAPGLEFAAIRSALAVGLLLLAFSALKGQWAWAIAAVSSHSSSAMALVGRLLVTHRARTLIFIALLLPAAAPVLLQLAADDARYTSYFDNRGTVRALPLPVLTWFASIGLAAVARRMNDAVPFARPEFSMAVLVCATAAVFLAIPSVTVSFRIMEIAWVLMLAQVLALKVSRIHLQFTLLASCAGMAFVITSSNLLRRTWAVMLGAAA